MADLQSNGDSVRLGDFILRTPGISGTAEEVDLGTAGARGGDDEDLPELIRAVNDLEAQFGVAADAAAMSFESLPTVRLTITDVDDERVTTSRSGGVTNAIELETPGPGRGMRQAVLAVNEDGIATWNFPPPETGIADSTRGEGDQAIAIRIPPPLDREVVDAESRGLISGVVKVALKVIVFPVIEKVAGDVVESQVHKWEMSNRPYLVRPFGPGNHNQGGVPALTGDEWRKLGEGRALLFLHGTFSRSDKGFGSFSDAHIATLNDAYEGRMFAFDHLTMSEDPAQNADAFISSIPEGVALDLDILCHSRGGLVARAIASAGRPNLSIRNVVFTATPNAGTILVDTDHIGSFIERYTNMISLIPDNGFTLALEMLILTAKHVASLAVDNLTGLQSMLPEGPFLSGDRMKHDPGATAYFALASNFEPKDKGWKSLLRDGASDLVFGKAGNDLIVPTDGVHAKNGRPGFPILEPQLFDVADGIAHSAYFAHDPAVSRIHEWLKG